MVEQASHTLISTDELQALIATGSPLRILDCSVNVGGGDEFIFNYYREHIHGAKFLDLKLARDLSSPFPFMMPSRDYFVLLAKSLDIRKSQTVVVYDGQQGAFACRGAFMLKAFGHPDVRILDGGLAKWKKEGKEVHGCKTGASAEDFSYELRPEGIRSFEQIVDIEKSGSAQIIDCRPPPGFQAGKIPTSVNVPAGQLANADGTFKSADEIRAIFSGAGIDLSKPMVFTCGAGVAATVGKHAVELTGATGERAVYDGSWSEYSVRSQQ